MPSSTTASTSCGFLACFLAHSVRGVCVCVGVVQWEGAVCAPCPLVRLGVLSALRGGLSSETRNHRTWSQEGWVRAPSWRQREAGVLGRLPDQEWGLSTTCCQPQSECNLESENCIEGVDVGIGLQTPKLDKSQSLPSHSPAPPILCCLCLTPPGPSN